jgi:ATP-dependent DNA helicase PIF1
MKLITHTRFIDKMDDLNDDQRAALGAVQAGKNIFLTGPAGSGKSYLIRRIVAWATDAGRVVSVTALTGCAALLLGNKAKTLHSWAGIGLGRESADKLAAVVMRTPRAKSRWKRTDILIVDEISMMTPDLFEKLDFIGRRVRARNASWGGIQLIVCGDYFQLPPVYKGISGESAAVGRFAFECTAWREAELLPVILTKIERQTDAAFQTLLNECRIGAPSAATIDLLRSRQGLDWKSREIRPTLLFSRNADVDAINEKNIAALEQPLRIFDAATRICYDAEYPDIPIPVGEELERIVTRLDNDANYSAHIELCRGAQVMLITNLDIEKGLVNGSRGVIHDFNALGHPIVKFLQGDAIAIGPHEWKSNDCPHVYRDAIPLRVAYAITIHKSQGATLDCALVDIGASTFEYGQAYVALSRVRDLESLYVHSLVPAKIKAHPAVTKFYMELMEAPIAAPTVLSTAASVFGADLVDDGWRTIVTAWASGATGAATLARVAERRAVATVYPAETDVLNALRYTPLASVKVVIIGQDPYHGAGQAHGLSFSVLPGTALPPSLRNIRKELIEDLGGDESVWEPHVGTLTPWARAGVLLLNAVLTVEAGNPDSHAGMGWEDLTQRLLGAVIAAHANDPVVVVAWGKKAQAIAYALRLGPKHSILAGTHPSPLSASSGFFKSRPFTRVNTMLVAAGSAPITWNLSAPPTTDDPS